ncbi:MAG: hypothetical protein ABIC91_04660 [Nanoarchaeota archaeon]|nr:hypothetical protein [Nanoarchaeota archaeon]MBU1030666.1 hypothetical protein [Nanoarchaeota archaeon]MBU1850737.1 hypothetical protein [Nanoarchaeota archaeon]
MKFKKGQAALEFLTTYGWAFLIILVMIGALAYFGVLSPERFVPERCKLSGEVECDTFTLTENNMRINLKNNMADEIRIVNITIIDPKTQNSKSNRSGVDYSVDIDPYTTASSGEIGHHFGLTPGDKVRYNLEITWYKISYGATYTRKATGDIVATVSA